MSAMGGGRSAPVADAGLPQRVLATMSGGRGAAQRTGLRNAEREQPTVGREAVGLATAKRAMVDVAGRGYDGRLWRCDDNREGAERFIAPEGMGAKRRQGEAEGG